MPLPSSGGILLHQMLSYISKEDFNGMQFHSPRVVHTLVEAERRAFADRAQYMGDPAFIKDPSALLTSEQYLTQRWKSFDSAVATPSAAVGKVVQPLEESTETTHISIYDALGNAVSLTTTLNGLYGSKVVVDGAGFFLNNEMDDFALKPGTPNAFGVMGYDANAVAPGKRPLSSMTPSFMQSADRVAVLGTPGGSRIITMVLLGMLGYDAGLDAAGVAALPRYHHQWLPDRIQAETGAFTPPVADALRALGHQLDLPGDTAAGGRGSSHVWGNLQTVGFDVRSGALQAASDPRNPEGAAVVEATP